MLGLLLGMLALVLLMNCEGAGTHGDGSSHMLPHLVLVALLWVLLGFMLLVLQRFMNNRNQLKLMIWTSDVVEQQVRKQYIYIYI